MLQTQGRYVLVMLFEELTGINPAVSPKLSPPTTVVVVLDDVYVVVTGLWPAIVEVIVTVESKTTVRVLGTPVGLTPSNVSISAGSSPLERVMVLVTGPRVEVAKRVGEIGVVSEFSFRKGDWPKGDEV